MKPLVCADCRIIFTPKPMGHNARYCSDLCKRRSQLARLRISNPNQLTQARARAYQQTKQHTDRYRKHIEGGREHRRTVREWLANYKLAHGCVDCGYRKHAAALQLDHEGPKSVEIADARSSIKRLQAEIEAGHCRVRCANCHSIKTAQRISAWNLSDDH